MAKWAHDIPPDAPVSELAANALDPRLSEVRRALRQVEREGEKREHVHRLRVATRRAGAAINLFQELLPGKKRRNLRKLLHRARRAAGEARDLDVFEKRLEPWLDIDPESGREIRERIEQERSEAVPKLERLRKKLEDREFPRAARKLVRRIEWRGEAAEPSACEAAISHLDPFLAAFRQAGAGELSDFAKLHQFRVAGKHLRYGLEIYGAILPNERRESLLNELTALQDELGEINDWVAAVDRLTDWIDAEREEARRAELSTLRESVRERLDERRLEFLRRYEPGWPTRFADEVGAAFAERHQRQEFSANGHDGQARVPCDADESRWASEFMD